MPRPDFTDKYNTPLTAKEEEKFQRWIKAQGREKDLFDYDMRGVWKEGASRGGNGHFTDKYKKPNHPTFSDESQYSGVDGFQGGQWRKQGDKWGFRASGTNVQMQTPDELRDYFKEREPGNELTLP